MTTAALKALSKATPTGRAMRLAGVAGALVAAVTLGVPLCPFALVTRCPCPGCGLTRATLAMLHGDLGGALHLHPLAPLVAPLVAAMLGYNGLVYVQRGHFAATEGLRGKWVTPLVGALGVAMIGVWIARFFGAFGGPVPV